METSDQESSIPQKPKQVTQAFYLLLGSSTISFLLFVANAILFWQEYYGSQPVSAIYLGLIYIIPFWIAFKINAGRNWARLLFLIVLAVTFLFGIPYQLRSFSDYPARSILSGISYTLDIAAMFLLFQSTSNNWFKYQAANKLPYDPFITEKGKLSVARRRPWNTSFLQRTEGFEGNKGNVILAASLGAITPQAIMFVLSLVVNSYRIGEYVVYTMCLTCLPAVLLGLIIGGLLSRLARGSNIDWRRIAVAYAFGLIGGLIPVGLILGSDYLTTGTALP